MLMVMAVLPFLSSCEDKENFWDVEYLAVQFDNGEDWSIINARGEVVVKEEYSSASYVSTIYKGVYWVKDDEGYHLYNIKEPKRPMIKTVYRNATDFAYGRAVVSNPDEPIKIIDTDGKVVKTLSEDIVEVSRYFEGMAMFRNSKDKWGYLDRDGNVAIPASYDMALWFSDGHACVGSESKDKEKRELLIIDKKGNVTGTIDFKKYAEITSFSFVDGMMTLYDTKTKEMVMVGYTGEPLLTVDGSYSSSFDDNAVFLLVSGVKDGYIVYRGKGGECGVVDYKGNEIIRPKYQALLNMGGGIFAAKKKGEFGFVDKEDNTLEDFEYDGILPLKLGDNFIVGDGEEIMLLSPKDWKKVGKTFVNASFFNVCDQSVKYERVKKKETAAAPAAVDGVVTVEPYTDVPEGAQGGSSVAGPTTFTADDNPYQWLSERPVNANDILGMSSEEIRLLRNAIFAMHGYKFKDKKLLEHFSQFTWYKPVSSDVTGSLSRLEQENIQFLKSNE